MKIKKYRAVVTNRIVIIITVVNRDTCAPPTSIPNHPYRDLAHPGATTSTAGCKSNERFGCVIVVTICRHTPRAITGDICKFVAQFFCLLFGSDKPTARWCAGDLLILCNIDFSRAISREYDIILQTQH